VGLKVGWWSGPRKSNCKKCLLLHVVPSWYHHRCQESRRRFNITADPTFSYTQVNGFSGVQHSWTLDQSQFEYSVSLFRIFGLGQKTVAQGVNYVFHRPRTGVSCNIIANPTFSYTQVNGLSGVQHSWTLDQSPFEYSFSLFRIFGLWQKTIGEG
jgi:hypothetical protein